MIIVEGSTQKLVEDGRKFFGSIRIIHSILAALMITTGVLSVIFSFGSDGAAKIPYYFSAFVSGVLHIVFVVLSQVCVNYLSNDRSILKHAPTWVNGYTVGSSVFVIFNVMGIVFAIVNGLCIRGQLCYYDKNETANRSLAISVILLHFVSIVFSVFLAKKSHLIDSQLGQDITIRINHSFVWGKGKSSKAKSSEHKSINSSEFTNTTDDSSVLGEGTSQNSDVAVVVVETKTQSWLDKKRAIIVNPNRSTSHPNLRHHLELNQGMDGTVISIYSDTEERSEVGTPRKGKRRRVIPKKNRVTPTSSIRDSPDSSSDSPIAHHKRTECEIQMGNAPLTVTIVEQQRREQLSSSIINVKETGLLSLSRDSSGMPSVDSKSDTDDAFVDKQEDILRQQQLVLQRQEELQSEQRDLLKQQSEVVKQHNELSAIPRPEVSDLFISPPPSYSEVGTS